MNEFISLLMRMQDSNQELDRAVKSVDKIDLAIGNKERVEFAKSELLKKLEEGKTRLKELKESVINGEQVSGERWTEYRELKEKTIDPLLKECLAMLEGSLVRMSKLDDGICRIADALIYDLELKLSVPWGRFTILDVEEYINNLANIIRIRFPGASIWSLPLVVHEFGHFVGEELKRTTTYGHYHPFEDLLNEAGRDPNMGKDFLREHFADHFATCVLGPSYAFACFMLRFDPLTANSEGQFHPSDNKRAYWILQVLKTMNEEQGGYSGIIDELKTVWEKSLAVAALPKSLEDNLGDEIINRLQAWIQKIDELIMSKLSLVCYNANGWLRAQRLKSILINNTTDKLPEECSLADVLNGGWLCRVSPDIEKNMAQMQLISERAIKICRKTGGIPT